MVWNLNNLYWLSAIFFTTVFALVFYINLAQGKNLLDEANQRSSHQGQVVTGGGIILMSIFFIAGLFFHIPFPLIAVVLGISVVGFFDDLFELGKFIRLLLQLTVVAYTLYFLNMQSVLGWGVLPIGFLALWWINAFNFMDGINGMAGLHVVSSVCWYLFMVDFTSQDMITSMGQVTLVVFVAYLLFNFPKARIFMGDSGSLPGALIIIIIAFNGLLLGKVNYCFIALLHAVFFADTTYTLITRVWNKVSFTQPHKTHCYQILVQCGWEHWHVSVLYALLTFIFGLIGWWINDFSNTAQILITTMIYIVLLMVFILLRRKFAIMFPDKSHQI